MHALLVCTSCLEWLLPSVVDYSNHNHTSHHSRKFDIAPKHITHTLEMSFGYAAHYLNVFRLMTNWQVMCERSLNLPTTCEPYAGICRKFCAFTKFFNDLAVLRCIPVCFCMLLTYTRHMHNLFDVCQCTCQIFQMSAYTVYIVKVWQDYKANKI